MSWMGCRRLCRPLTDLDEHLLVAARRKFHADAVLVGTLRHYRPYWPPRIGVTLHMIETTQAVTVASVDGLWNADDKTVAKQARGYFETLSPKTTLPQSEIVLHAPRHFSNFVAYQ